MYVAKISLTSTIINNEYIADIAHRAKRHLEEPAPIYFLLVVILFPSLCSLRLLTLHNGALLGELLTFNLKHQSIECYTWLNPDSLVD